jgi:hypothetical protein
MELDEVIAQSTFRVEADTYWMYGETCPGTPDLPLARRQSGTPAGTVWAVVTDGTERTTIVSSAANPGVGDAEYYGPLRAIRIRPSSPFNAPGFLAAATTAIAAYDISILAISTYSYDYIFTSSEHLPIVIAALAARGFIQEKV